MFVLLNPAEGWAQIGSLRVAVRLTGRDGALQINGNNGPCLRHVSFMERSRLASYASVSRQPAPALAKLVTEASLRNTKQDTTEVDPIILSVIALVLAGGDEDIPLSFAEATMLVAQQSGWTPELLGESNALDVDRLAKQLIPDVDDGWIQLKFDSSEETDITLIRDKLANNLLVRLQPGSNQLHSALANVDTAKDSPTDSEQFRNPLPLQSRQVVDYRSGLLGESELTKAKEASSSGSVFLKPERVRTKEEKVLSSIAEESKDNTEAVSGPAKEMLSTDRSRPVSFAKTDSPLAAEKRYGINESDFSQNRQPRVDKDVAIARGGRGLPSLEKSALQALMGEFAPDVIRGNGETEPRAIPLSTPSPAGLHDRAMSTADDIIAHRDNIITEDTLQAQVSLESRVQSKNELSEVIDEFAARLHFEADLRGIDR